MHKKHKITPRNCCLSAIMLCYKKKAKKHFQLCLALLETPHHGIFLYNDFDFECVTCTSKLELTQLWHTCFDVTVMSLI